MVGDPPLSDSEAAAPTAADKPVTKTVTTTTTARR
jgi:hypothetical protein